MKNIIKRIIKIILGVIIVFVLYEIIGGIAPFVFHKKVNQTYQENFSVEKFYNQDGPSVDRAAVVESSLDALNLRLKMIYEAKEQIILSTFDIREGESTKDIFAALMDAANRGVNIRILVDGLSGMINMADNPMFYAAGAHENIEIRFYSKPNLLKPWTFNGLMHDKYLITDDKALLLGGRNTFDYFLGEYNMQGLSLDREVLVYNSANGTDDSKQSGIHGVIDYFETVWSAKESKSVYEASSKHRQEEYTDLLQTLSTRYDKIREEKSILFDDSQDYELSTVPVDKVTLVSNPIHIMNKEPYVWYELQQLMLNAKERVMIHTPYAVFSKDMYSDMTEIAEVSKEKGIPFSMLLNSVAVGDNVMASSDYTMNKRKVLDTGVSLYEYYGERSSHGKSILVDDDISVIGSFNFDMRSAYLDTETMLVIHGEEFNKQLEYVLSELQKDAVYVNEDGTYDETSQVQREELPTSKKIFFRFMSVIIQLVRYLV